MNILYHLLDNSGSYTAHQIVEQKSFWPPYLLSNTSEHPYSKHVEKYVRESGVHEHICYQLCCIEIFGKEKMQSQILGEVDAVALGDDGTQKHQHIND